MAERKPVLIGITTSFGQGVQRLRRTYVEAVERAGAVPVLLPAVERRTSVESLFDALDGLVVTGGPGITRGLVGSLPEDLPETPPERARFDENITRTFVESTKPVLGICYGMQLLNVLDGGTLYADVERQRQGSLRHSKKRGGDDHTIEIASGSLLQELLATRETTVNSRHIQALDAVGDSYRIAATAPDGVVEAIESDDGRLLGVQFHPELLGGAMAPLFRHLVERAGR